MFSGLVDTQITGSLRVYSFLPFGFEGYLLSDEEDNKTSLMHNMGGK